MALSERLLAAQRDRNRRCRAQPGLRRPPRTERRHVTTHRVTPRDPFAELKRWSTCSW